MIDCGACLACSTNRSLGREAYVCYHDTPVQPGQQLEFDLIVEERFSDFDMRCDGAYAKFCRDHYRWAVETFHDLMRMETIVRYRV